MNETAKFRRMDEGKKRRRKTYKQEKEAKEAHLKNCVFKNCIGFNTTKNNDDNHER